MKNIWRRKMCVGDLVVFDDEFYKSMKSVADIREIAIITEVKDL